MTWRARAACKGRDDIDWFEEHDRHRCAAICAVCPVQDECLEDALLEGRDQFGFRAGYTARQRQKMPRARERHRAPAPCGTDSGYYAHIRRTLTEPCGPCRAAHVDANQRRENARRASV